MRPAAVVLTVAMLLALAPSTAGEAVDEPGSVDGLEAGCSPPCGEINPRITFSFPDQGDGLVDLEEGESVTFDGEVIYWTDADDEGHAPRDPTQEIVIQFSFPRLPTWATMSIEPNQVQVPINTCPDCLTVDAEDRTSASFEYSEEIQLTITAEDPPEATEGYDYGKLQVFAKSTESGIYNPGYGIREVRVTPADAEALDAQSSDEGSFAGVPGAGAALAASLLAIAALTRRR